MSGSLLHRNWEASTVPGSSEPGGAGKGNHRRLLEPIGNLSPAEADAACYR